MIKFVIIADDLTGANATCSLLKKVGLRTASLVKLEGIQLEEDLDVLSFSTDSRAAEPQIAYERVKKAIDMLKSDEILIYNKRIDSTLRGNLGCEIDAMLDGLGDNRVAIVVPVFPVSERIAVNGTLLVNGKLLECSDAARDPKTPIHTSKIEDLFNINTKRRVASIYLDEISKGEDYLSKRLQETAKDNEIIILDGVTHEDLVTISRALLKSRLDYITVDPGPFTMQLSKEVLESQNKFKKILMTVGSVTDTTRDQLEEVLKSYHIHVSKVNAQKLIYEQTRLNEMNRVIEEVKEGIKDHDLLLVTTTPFEEEEKLDLHQIAQSLNEDIDAISLRISKGIAKISKEILINHPGFAGVFSSGGDITVALCEELDSLGIEIKEEVVPLAAYGRLIGGHMPNLRIVTKGGMVGNRNTMKICLERIKNYLN